MGAEAGAQTGLALAIKELNDLKEEAAKEEKKLSLIDWDIREKENDIAYLKNREKELTGGG